MKDVSGGFPIEIHCHNDFGMALASTVEGVLSGCEYVSCTMNGLGPHGGNVALTENRNRKEKRFAVNSAYVGGA